MSKYKKELISLCEDHDVLPLFFKNDKRVLVYNKDKMYFTANNCKEALIFVKGYIEGVAEISRFLTSVQRK